MAPDQILAELHIGSYPTSMEDIRLLKTRGVSAVLSLQTNDDLVERGLSHAKLESWCGQHGLVFWWVPIVDYDPVDLHARLPAAVDSLHTLLSDGHTAYLHCNAGINRAPTAAAAYLWRHRGFSLNRAIAWVKARRTCEPEFWVLMRYVQENQILSGHSL